MHKIISRKQARRLITSQGARYQTFLACGDRDRDSISHDLCSTVTDNGRTYGILTDYKRGRVFWVSDRL